VVLAGGLSFGNSHLREPEIIENDRLVVAADRPADKPSPIQTFSERL
jgi:hypothetical protein